MYFTVLVFGKLLSFNANGNIYVGGKHSNLNWIQYDNKPINHVGKKLV